MTNNADLIYKYTEKEVENFNKSIDIVTGKLTTSLGFAGVVIKFVSDLESGWIKIALTTFVVASILAAFVGLFPKDRGDTLRCKAFFGDKADWWFGSPSEEVQMTIANQWVDHVRLLGNLLDFRTICLKISHGCLVVAALLFAFGK